MKTSKRATERLQKPKKKMPLLKMLRLEYERYGNDYEVPYLKVRGENEQQTERRER